MHKWSPKACLNHCSTVRRESTGTWEMQAICMPALFFRHLSPKALKILSSWRATTKFDQIYWFALSKVHQKALRHLYRLFASHPPPRIAPKGAYHSRQQGPPPGGPLATGKKRKGWGKDRRRKPAMTSYEHVFFLRSKFLLSLQPKKDKMVREMERGGGEALDKKKIVCKTHKRFSHSGPPLQGANAS